ncbi:hypothetical protein [Synechococcus sp. PCC 7336]|uniref:hypothetical protein n=1 Tax=Synechococcus sp. PCC 7336 TaxID=195250 RepID=UPI00047552E1|nr:hypothetical protein [Synechococcus sp. PCC 7336]
MARRGAGGTKGGVGRFLMGLIMTIGGGYLFFNSISVVNNFSFGYRLYRLGSFNLTSGMVLIPFLFGIGMIFYDGKNFFGWMLSLGSLIALTLGVISSINFQIQPMSAFELLTILVLFFGGLGLLISSLRDVDDF